jgi:hypothetical protein
VLFCDTACGSLAGMRSVGGERGQATADYVALIALLAVLLTVMAGFVGVGAPGVANAVLGQFRQALCVVAGGACPPAPRKPCTVASTRDARHVAVNLGLVRLDDDRVVLRERLSDGTIRLTVSERGGAGVEGGVGGNAHVELGRRRIGFGGEARAGVEGIFGHGAVYYARSEREAGALLEAIRRPRLGTGGPRAQEVFYEGGVSGLGRLVGGAARVLSGQLDGIATAMLGARHDRRSGTWTISLGAGGAGAGLVSIAVGGDAGGLDGQAVLGLTLDRRRRPVELSLSATGRVAAGATLPAGIADALQQAADPRTSARTAGRRWELGARVGLGDPAVAGAWEAFRASPTSAAAIRALGEQLRSNATVDVRSYRLDGVSTGAGGTLALGLRIGGEYEHETDRAKLLTAATRPPFGLWEARVDCVGVV